MPPVKCNYTDPLPVIRLIYFLDGAVLTAKCGPAMTKGLQAHAYIHTYMYIHTVYLHMHMYIHTVYLHMYIHTVYLHMYMYMYIHLHMYMHTGTINSEFRNGGYITLVVKPNKSPPWIPIPLTRGSAARRRLGDNVFT